MKLGKTGVGRQMAGLDLNVIGKWHLPPKTGLPRDDIRRGVMVSSAALDGRLIWMRTSDDMMFPTAQRLADDAEVMAVRAEPLVLALLEKTNRLRGKYHGKWMQRFLYPVAESLLRLRALQELPPAGKYAKVATRIANGAEKLLRSIEGQRANFLENINVALLSSQPQLPLTLRIDLWDPLGQGDHALTDVLKVLIKAAEAQKEFKSYRGPRLRHDLEFAVAAAGDLWTYLSERPFPKSVQVHEGHFEAESARFAEQFTNIFFDPSPEFGQIHQALKALRVPPSKLRRR